jgi:hypothetical protein
MKTELTAKWVLVEGHLELRWIAKDDNRVVMINCFAAQFHKAA